MRPRPGPTRGCTPSSWRRGRAGRGHRRLGRRGALEGMGLELIISFLIVGVGVALLFGWLAYVEMHHLSGVTVRDVRGVPTTFVTSSALPVQVWVKAVDERGNGLPGVSIVLEGGGTAAGGTTLGNGSVLIAFNPTPPAHSPYVEMTATATYVPPTSLGNPPVETGTTTFVVYLP